MNRRGLTLIEIMIVVGILGIVVLMLNTVFKTGFDAWNKSEVRLEIYQNARVVLDQMSRELPGAFVTGVAGDVAQFQGADGTSNNDTLKFVTTFADAIYLIRYSLNTTTKILNREYAKNPTSFDPTFDNPGSEDFGFKIKELNFLYCNSASSWTLGGTWSTTTVLPDAVKIMIKGVDSDGNDYPFETIIYLPNSE